MNDQLPILVLGPAALAERVRRAVSAREVVAVENPLSGVFELGKLGAADVVLALDTADEADSRRTIPTLRQIAPQARIILACSPAAEPVAREIQMRDADDYLLEPIDEEELRRLLRRPTHRAGSFRISDDEPSVAELVEFGEILRRLGDGPQAALDRLAALTQRSLQARGVSIELDGLHAALGDPADAVLEQTIYRNGERVGQLRIGKNVSGSYAASVASRISDMSRLIESAVSEARERDRLRELAWTDDLSGLRNRRYFETKLDELLEAAADQRFRVTVLLFDIDDFKQYNDQYGHDTGDALIRELGMLLKRCCRADDVVTRYGGDEFAVIFWDAEEPRVAGSKHPEEPRALASRFQDAIGAHQFTCLGAAAPGPVTISGGLACYPWNGRDRASLLTAADQALLCAKRTGKNQIALAGEPFQAETTSDH